MKTLYVILLLVLLASCAEKKDPDFEFGEGECSNEIQVGRWGNSYDNLYVSGDCRGRIDYCDADFTYTPFILGSLSVVTVSTSNNQPGCMGVGIHSCHFTLYNGISSLQLMCDALIPEFYYTRK